MSLEPAPPTFVYVEAAHVLHITGQDRLDLLHRLSSQDLRPLETPGSMASTLFLTAQGKLIDWTYVVSQPGYLWVCTSPGRTERVKEWISQFTIMEDVHMEDVSSQWCRVLVHGPQAAHRVGLAELPPPGEGVYHEAGWWWRGPAGYRVRLEGLIPAEMSQAWQERLCIAGAVPMSARHAEVMRLQAGVPSATYEFAQEVNPLQLRLGPHAISWNKGCYVGQEVMSRLDAYHKVARLLMGFESHEAPGLPSDPIASDLKLTDGHQVLGRVTSYAMPFHGGVVGLALVKQAAAVPAQVHMRGAETTWPVQLVDRPFWKA